MDYKDQITLMMTMLCRDRRGQPRRLGTAFVSVTQDGLTVTQQEPNFLSVDFEIFGHVQGLKVWLSKEGSPTSRITRASFSNQRPIDKLELSGFKTRF
ncbi:Acylphosphatase-2 [Nibea albiflora]|uniref:Acylphosphatase-2 n=1 Tax=Nibea albiflora TaxID=240163 RepID=A0ACB7EDV5_NIBAL|nr:Acylphosphatase-2 [Nibea albiflora]